MIEGKSFSVFVSDYDISMCKYYTATSIFYILCSYLNIIKYFIIMLTFMYVMPPLLILSSVFYNFRRHMVLSGTGIVKFPTNTRAFEFYLNNFANHNIVIMVFFVLLLTYLLKIAIFNNKDIYNTEVDRRLYYSFFNFHCTDKAKNLKFSKVNYPDGQL